MAKKGSVKFVCSACGAFASAWTGRCNNCGEWNTLVEQLDMSDNSALKSGKNLPAKNIKEVLVEKQAKRLFAGMGEVDSVLGGGFVAGSVNLLAGQPGIGKSTLILQIANYIAKTQPVLYVSGEESEYQIGLRAKRLGANSKHLNLAMSTSANDIAVTIASEKYKFVVVDSIQTMNVEGISSAPGSVSQITNSAQLLGATAKSTNTVLVIIGHVTKEGSIAGPKILEHVVDVVLQLEGDRYGGFKVLRTQKNRFGSTTEAGIFEMDEVGLKEVENPSASLLAERQVNSGSIVLATLEGMRPVLVEVQALVNTTSYGYPKRTASGIDLNRLNLLTAMLEQRTKLKLSDKDIFINIVGGIRLDDPAIDLAVCMAIGSATKNLLLKKNAVIFGEVGLSGEVRHVPLIEKRLAEAKKLGFEGAIGPKLRSGKKDSFLLSVPDVRTALNTYLEKD
jgi:DNA repair protein RadA/Sms